MEIHIQVDGAERLYKMLGLDIIQVIAPAIESSGYRVEAEFKVYPRPPGAGEWARDTSSRQKVAFFAKLRSGEWTGRTGQYGGGWQMNSTRTVSQAISEIYNPVEYAGWVGSAERQARMHRGRWPTDLKILTKETPLVIADVAKRITDALDSV